MEMSIPCCICAEISQIRNIWGDKSGHRKEITAAMPTEGNRDHRGAAMHGPRAYAPRHFWARGYYVDAMGRNKKQIQEYIKNQLTEDQIADQIGMKELVDPFTGSVNQKA